MVIDVAATNDEIKIMPSNVLEEIMQNVKMIISTAKETVPLDREFGIRATVLDKPIATAQALLSSEIVAAVNRFEPRAKVKKIIYQGKEKDGILEPTVRIEVNEDGI